MLTQCPECQTTFRITHAILRAANGQVRCGRCRTQFDASQRLLDDEGQPLVYADTTSTPRDRDVPEPVNPATTMTDIVVEEPPAQEDITLEGQRIEITGTYRVPTDAPQAVADQIVREVHVIERAMPDTTERSDDAEEDAEEIVSTAQLLARRVAEEDEALLREAESKLATSDEEAAQVEPTPVSPQAPPPTAVEDEFDLLGQPKPRKQAAAVWKIALAPLALLLLVQIIHHERAELARHPRIGAWLTSVYGALGLTLDPAWDLRAYDLKQRGVMADPSRPGTLMVRATITNLANYPQPYPLLKLVLEDRWGSAVRTREFEPDEYAQSNGPHRLLAPNQKAEARIAIADPGPEAEGFRFDLCLKRAQGIVCAEEAP
jgi:predicted Zn finger-like uncharacterized protein